MKKITFSILNRVYKQNNSELNKYIFDNKSGSVASHNEILNRSKVFRVMYIIQN